MGELKVVNVYEVGTGSEVEASGDAVEANEGRRVCADRDKSRNTGHIGVEEVYIKEGLLTRAVELAWALMVVWVVSAVVWVLTPKKTTTGTVGLACISLIHRPLPSIGSPWTYSWTYWSLRLLRSSEQ